MDSVPLDPALVERFNGKVMAIVGFEADQVCKSFGNFFRSDSSHLIGYFSLGFAKSMTRS